MMDPAQILSQRVVDRYCAGQLSPEETAEFEAYLLDHPELHEEIDITRRLKLGLGSLRAKGELPALVDGRARATRKRLLAIAASVMIAAGVAWFFSRQRIEVTSPILAATLDGFRAELRAPDAIAELLLIRSRSGERLSLEMPSAPHLYRVHVLAETQAADSRFDIELRREPPAGGSPALVQRLADVRPDADGMLLVYLDPQRAGAGSYVLRVLGHGGAQGYTGEYAFALK